ncbi:CDP-glycerol glycerophosphotransferase family protein [Vagococcus intermedius]|uniref:CDP-glycerol glycerophosphotransferase family protein n=1 Tax=Vagococcus intermedius TaxID=2991418 RepID=A0AAF0CVI8_9ENTE|nr:CDP-glycerol glycerophosphotransferase family protein [Vagococcus intermedius]WEG73617.1 CDP-glycerol glycerophosphotransferase family protein [Vagococcus intermedius]WEG75701.1 CDP-glycerol glycerophosphotransferase family protein [Vagococcus intermedius]
MKITNQQRTKFMRLFSKFIPHNKKMIVFESFLGRQYSDNPKALYEYIKEHYPDYICYWSIDPKYKDKFNGLDIQTVPRLSFKWYWVMLRSKYWISNSRLPLWIFKPKKTVYTQTWHGTPLKKLALDMENIKIAGTSPAVYKENFVKDARKWDYLISPNAYSTEIFKRCFTFENTLIESGYPRNDYLINENTSENIENIKKRLNIPKDKKIILYAPTWRDKFSFDLPLSLTNMSKDLGDDYFIIVRLHYLVTQRPNLVGYEDFIKDVTDYNDISDLYLISDLLVTDYSSVFFDYAILKRPMFFHCYDLDLYKNELRGFYFDFENEAPGPIVRTSEELTQAIRASEDESVQVQYHDFYEQFANLEKGISAKLVVEEILTK